MLRLTLFRIFELWFFASTFVLKIPPERAWSNAPARAPSA